MADPISWMVVSAVASVGISYLFPSEGPRMGDLRVSASTYGSMIPEVYGTCRVGANMIWNNPIREQKKKKKQGKGGGYYNEYTYYCDFAMGFCKGPIANFRRIWADGKLVYDATGASEAFSNGQYRMRMYLGGEAQLPDSLIEKSKGEGNTPAYRGLAYVVFENLPLKDFGNRLPQMAGEVFSPGEATAGIVGDRANYTRLPGAPLTSASDRGVADWAQGYYYQRGSAGYGVDGLRRVRISDGVEDRVVLAADMGLSSPATAWKSEGELNEVLAVAADGSILVTYDGVNNYAPIARIDPVSLTQIGQIGRSHPFGGLPTDLPVAGPRADPNGACDGMIYCHLGQIGNGLTTVALVDVESMSIIVKDEDTMSEGRGVCAADQGEGIFYLISQATTHALKLWRMDQGGLSELATITSTTVGLSAGLPIGAEGIVYDGSSPGFIFTGSSGNTEFMAKWSTDLGDLAWSKRVSIDVGIGASRLTSGEYVWSVGDTIYAINTDTGEWIDRDADAYADVSADYDINDGSQGVPIVGGSASSGMQAYDSVRGVIVRRSQLIRSGIVVGEGVTLASIVGAILRKGSMTSKDFDLTALEGTYVRGYGWASATDIKSIIDELKKLYLFDLIETNGKLTARMRGDGTLDDVDFVIPQDVLGSSGAEAMDFWQETRLSEADLPERVTLAYMNLDEDFETSTASSIRISSPIPTMWSRQQIQMQANLVCVPNEAKDIVHRILYSQWLERTKHETRLPWAYLDLDPTDTIKVVMNDGRTYYDRVHMTEIGANFTIEVEAYGQDSGAYEAETVADGGGAARPDTVSLAKPAKVFILNTPLLRDADDTAGGFSRYYSAVGQTSPGTFRGATVFRSTNGTDFDDLYAEPAEVEWGSTTTALPAPRYGFEALDWENTITVFPAVTWFDVSSITDEELWAGANLVMVGDEAVQFRDAIENADGTWTLSNLLRGRRGTEYACANHKVGEPFIFLDVETVEGQGDLITARGQTRVFKAVAPGLSLNTAQTLNLTYEPRDLMPYAPADIRRTIEVSDDITITWARRTRLGGNLVDGTGDVNLAEAAEKYEVYLLSEAFDGDLSRGTEPDPAKVLRKVETLTPEFIYTAAMQALDGHVTELDTIHLVIYQISGSVGRGFPGVRSISADRDF